MLQQCYYPNGNLTGSNPPLVPCDPNAPNTSCCVGGDTCFTNGMCMSQQFFFSRGGCTHKNWDKACAQKCVSAPSIVSSNSNLDFWQIMTPCEDPFMSKSTEHLYTCSPVYADCAIGNFSTPPGNVTFSQITGSAAVSTISTTNSNSSSTSNNTAVSCPVDSVKSTGISPAALGAGTAVPIVVISLLALFFFFREHKQLINAEKQAREWADVATANFTSTTQSTVIPPYAVEAGGTEIFQSSDGNPHVVEKNQKVPAQLM